MKYYLLLFFFAYVVLTMLLPRWRMKRATGQEVFVVPRDDSAQGFIGRMFKLLFGLAFVVLAIHAFAPQWEPYLLPAEYLVRPSAQWAGLALLHFSLIMVLVAQAQMARSWRVGFDENAKTELVQGGLFRYSRNPVFVGMLLTMLGLFLVLPNALTLLAAALTWMVLEIQVRMEEAYLLKAHGEAYSAYMKQVRRWF
ncbi:MAG: isoprenylcysteine carboxylmethyltransferase family protein [Saprospiraceae bacterium]|nr:isoprenylcysteine carboxylmethyltransferase family protein [Saprospiraceae bacterium]